MGDRPPLTLLPAVFSAYTILRTFHSHPPNGCRGVRSPPSFFVFCLVFLFLQELLPSIFWGPCLCGRNPLLPPIFIFFSSPDYMAGFLCLAPLASFEILLILCAEFLISLQILSNFSSVPSVVSHHCDFPEVLIRGQGFVSTLPSPLACIASFIPKPHHHCLFSLNSFECFFLTFQCPPLTM